MSSPVLAMQGERKQLCRLTYLEQDMGESLMANIPVGQEGLGGGVMVAPPSIRRMEV